VAAVATVIYMGGRSTPIVPLEDSEPSPTEPLDHVPVVSYIEVNFWVYRDSVVAFWPLGRVPVTQTGVDTTVVGMTPPGPPPRPP
jgi:hypothetical protein